MPSAVVFAKRAVRALLRRLVPIVSSRPWLVAIAARVFARMPGLKSRLRHIVSTPTPVPVVERELTPLQAAVLVDLQQAVRDRRGAP